MCHMAVTPAIMFLVDTRGDCRVSAGESGLSGVNLDISVCLNCGMTPGVPLEFQVENASS